jgi:hypothetical protein
MQKEGGVSLRIQEKRRKNEKKRAITYKKQQILNETPLLGACRFRAEIFDRDPGASKNATVWRFYEASHENKKRKERHTRLRKTTDRAVFR